MPKPIQIGTIAFPSRKAAMEYTRVLRDKYKDGERIGGQDEKFLRDLIDLHSDKEEKIDVGIVYFIVGKDAKWGTTRCFYLVRGDGSKTDFSFDNCINGKNPVQDVIDAFRVAVADQVISFKRQKFPVGVEIRCPIDASCLTKVNSDVDHIPPQTFITLVGAWLRENGRTLLDIELVPNADNQWARTLRDESIVLSWQIFHRIHARLRMTSKNANRSKKASKS
jgi:hypothetical protein